MLAHTPSVTSFYLYSPTAEILVKASRPSNYSSSWCTSSLRSCRTIRLAIPSTYSKPTRLGFVFSISLAPVCARFVRASLTRVIAFVDWLSKADYRSKINVNKPLCTSLVVSSCMWLKWRRISVTILIVTTPAYVRSHVLKSPYTKQSMNFVSSTNIVLSLLLSTLSVPYSFTNSVLIWA